MPLARGVLGSRPSWRRVQGGGASPPARAGGGPTTLGSVHTTRIFVLRQGRKAFYEGSVLLRYSTGIKSLSDAGRGQKDRSVNRP